MNEDRIFIAIARTIGYLTGKLIRFVFDVIVYLIQWRIASVENRPKLLEFSLHERFAHTHIVGGSGHGKTQLIQKLILEDLPDLREGKVSVIVIDSQGDLIRNILNLADIKHLSDSNRLVFINPYDMRHLPALNLFDFGLDRLGEYGEIEKQRLLIGAVALYEYLFGALLGAELTMRQGVVFSSLARLLMVVPGARIDTLLDFVDNPELTRPYLAKLDPLSQRFFETQFFSPRFDSTRQQISDRLWGVLTRNNVLQRMFRNEKNKVDLFAAMNRGSLVLINTAKDLLKQEGCEIFGRFFIALICQAAQERAIIPEEKRKSTFVYIDEAQDYFDESLENLFNQGRKYKVGLIIAHQNLRQFDQKLLATVMSSTFIKMVGGLSGKDAGAFANEMQCEPEQLQAMQKHNDRTEFACFIRNRKPPITALIVPFLEMEKRPRLTDEDYDAVLEGNCLRYCATDTEQERVNSDKQEQSTTGFTLGKPEEL